MQSLDLFNKPTQIYSSLKFNLKWTGIKFLQLLKKKGHKHLGEGSKPKKFIQNNRVNSWHNDVRLNSLHRWSDYQNNIGWYVHAFYNGRRFTKTWPIWLDLRWVRAISNKKTTHSEIDKQVRQTFFRQIVTKLPPYSFLYSMNVCGTIVVFILRTMTKSLIIVDYFERSPVTYCYIIAHVRNTHPCRSCIDKLDLRKRSGFF